MGSAWSSSQAAVPAPPRAAPLVGAVDLLDPRSPRMDRTPVRGGGPMRTLMTPPQATVVPGSVLWWSLLDPRSPALGRSPLGPPSYALLDPRSPAVGRTPLRVRMPPAALAQAKSALPLVSPEPALIGLAAMDLSHLLPLPLPLPPPPPPSLAMQVLSPLPARTAVLPSMATAMLVVTPRAVSARPTPARMAVFHDDDQEENDATDPAPPSALPTPAEGVRRPTDPLRVLAAKRLAASVAKENSKGDAASPAKLVNGLASSPITSPRTPLGTRAPNVLGSPRPLTPVL
jgi:hypothetical protein